MNENLRTVAANWVNLATNDLRGKIDDFIEMANSSFDEFANILGIDSQSLYNMLNGDEPIDLSTFAKILISLGLVLKVESIENAPFNRGFVRGGAQCVNNHGMRANTPRVEHPQVERTPFERPRVERTPFERPRVERTPFERPRVERTPFERPRVERTPFERPRVEHPQAERTPFDNMSTDMLVKIIRDRIWDSEIDLSRATKQELISFLLEKDRQIRNRRMRNCSHATDRCESNTTDRDIEALEEDPRVIDFKRRIIDAAKANPNLASFLRNLN